MLFAKKKKKAHWDTKKIVNLNTMKISIKLFIEL